MPCALVLSGGGMFGAYQAGAWKALAGRFRPDMVVGVSAGALNGWAIAGGCSPEELCDVWLERASADLMHLRVPKLPWKGFCDPAPLRRTVEDFCARFRPRLPFGLTMVQAPHLKEVLVTGDRVTPAHMQATCAIPFVYEPVRIDGHYYVDGGLLTTLPLWAASQMGATSAVAINVLPGLPSKWMELSVRAFRAVLAPRAHFPNLEVTLIRPARMLGSAHDAVTWNQENMRRWIAQGEREADAVFAGVSGPLREASPR